MDSAPRSKVAQIAIALLMAVTVGVLVVGLGRELLTDRHLDRADIAIMALTAATLSYCVQFFTGLSLVEYVVKAARDIVGAYRETKGVA